MLCCFWSNFCPLFFFRTTCDKSELLFQNVGSLSNFILLLSHSDVELLLCFGSCSAASLKYSSWTDERTFSLKFVWYIIRIHASINNKSSPCSKSKANIAKITVLHCSKTFVVNTYFMIVFSYIVDCLLLVYFAFISLSCSLVIHSGSFIHYGTALWSTSVLFECALQTLIGWLILFLIHSIIIGSSLLQHFITYTKHTGSSILRQQEETDPRKTASA